MVLQGRLSSKYSCKMERICALLSDLNRHGPYIMMIGRLRKSFCSVQNGKYSYGRRFITKATIVIFVIVSAANALIIDRLDTTYYANNGLIDNFTHHLNFTDMGGVLERLDSYDVLYTGFFEMSMNDACTKIVSIVSGEELEANVKPFDYTSTHFELSIITRYGSPTQIPDGHYLRFNFHDTGYPTNDFDGRPITLWREDPNNPGSYYFYADIRDAINNNGGVVPLPTYYSGQTVDSEEVYDRYMIACKFSLADLYLDGEINLRDFAVLANDWGNEDANIVNADSDINGSGIVDANDLTVIVEEWLLSE